jgi:hypothetical protein
MRPESGGNRTPRDVRIMAHFIGGKRIWKPSRLIHTLPDMIFLASLLFTAATRLPIIDDDYPRACAEAIERNVPLFVDVWAPW